MFVWELVKYNKVEVYDFDFWQLVVGDVICFICNDEMFKNGEIVCVVQFIGEYVVLQVDDCGVISYYFVNFEIS